MLNPMNRDFLLYNGKAWNFGYEFGVRYNIGSAIERNCFGSRQREGCS